MALMKMESLLLAVLITDGPQEDPDNIVSNSLIQAGLVKRNDCGQIEITATGVAELERQARERGDGDDLFNGDHGF